MARDALLPWAAGDPATPMDVDPDQTVAEVVLELERSHKDAGSFFESVPVVVFADKGRKSARMPARRDAIDESVVQEQKPVSAVGDSDARRARGHVPGRGRDRACALPVEGMSRPKYAKRRKSSLSPSPCRLYIHFNKFDPVGSSTTPSWPSRTIQSG